MLFKLSFFLQQSFITSKHSLKMVTKNESDTVWLGKEQGRHREHSLEFFFAETRKNGTRIERVQIGAEKRSGCTINVCIFSVVLVNQN